MRRRILKLTGAPEAWGKLYATLLKIGSIYVGNGNSVGPVQGAIAAECGLEHCDPGRSGQHGRAPGDLI